MKTITSIWFECKIRYEKVNEEGLEKPVVETYVVAATSFTEAEARVIEKMAPYISGEFEVVDMKKAPFKEVIFSEGGSDDLWYKAKLDFITIDEKTEKEKRSRVNFLVQASDFRKALNNVDSVMNGTMIGYETCTIQATKIFDVFAE